MEAIFQDEEKRDAEQAGRVPDAAEKKQGPEVGRGLPSAGHAFPFRALRSCIGENTLFGRRHDHLDQAAMTDSEEAAQNHEVRINRVETS